MEVARRQLLFSGTEAPPPGLELDSVQLAAFLGRHIGGLERIASIEKFKGGQSNPTYLVRSDAGDFVLRRKPPGKLLASAHAIDREYRVLNAVASAGYPVPKAYLYCADESVIGSEFYLVGYHPGRIFWTADLLGESPGDRSAIYDAMNARLAELHRLDHCAIGLSDFGRVGGYVARNLARWSKIYRDSELISIPDMDWLIGRLPEMLPPDERSCLLHGDFGLYNLIIEPDAPEISAVLDWEMATLGDPFIDLAHNLRAWWEVPDPTGAAATSLRGHDLGVLGIPTMDAYIDGYCARMGISELPHRNFYLGYAQFRNAAMVQGILKRAAIGSASSRAKVHRQERVPEIAAMARATLENRPR